MSVQLQIEVTNVCNAACVFCEYPTMTRPKGTMPMGLFFKIVDDAVGLPLINHFTLTGLGETLLDRHLVERIRYIRGVAPEHIIDLYTNGTFLRPKLTDQLIEAGLTTLYLSLNAVNAKQRQEVMKLDDWDEVLEQARYAVKAFRKVGRRAVIKGIIAKDLMDVDDRDSFIQMFGGPTELGGDAFLHLEGNWAGAVWPLRTNGILTKACSRALSQIMVLHDGRVSLCCFDGDGREILGDLNVQSIREVYNSERATWIRTAHHEGRRNEVAICAGCTGI